MCNANAHTYVRTKHQQPQHFNISGEDSGEQKGLPRLYCVRSVRTTTFSASAAALVFLLLAKHYHISLPRFLYLLLNSQRKTQYLHSVGRALIGNHPPPFPIKTKLVLAYCTRIAPILLTGTSAMLINCSNKIKR